jgi:hypothetical protein
MFQPNYFDHASKNRRHRKKRALEDGYAHGAVDPLSIAPAITARRKVGAAKRRT